MEKKKQTELKQNRLPLLEAVLATISNYFVAVASFVVLCGSFGAKNIHVGSLCIFIGVPFIFFALRRKCKKVLLFLGGHLLTVVLWGCILNLGKNSVVECILYSIMLLVYIGVSIYLKSKTEDGAESHAHPAVMVAILMIGFWILNYVENQQFQPFLLAWTAVYFGVYFAHYYLGNYLSFVKVNKISVGKFQGKKLFRSGAGLVAGYLVFSVVLLLFFTNPAMGAALTAGLKKVLWVLLKCIFFFFRPNGSEEEPIVEEVVEESTIPMEEEFAAAETGLLWQILDKLLEIIFFLVFIVAIIAAVVWIVRKFREMFRGGRRTMVIEGEASIQDITEQLEKEESRQKQQSIFYAWSINSRIRKTYAKFMLGHQKQVEEALKSSLSCTTAREHAGAFGKEAKDPDSIEKNEMEDVAQTYEKARYSGEECIAAELRSMKKGLSKIRR